MGVIDQIERWEFICLARISVPILILEAALVLPFCTLVLVIPSFRCLRRVFLAFFARPGGSCGRRGTGECLPGWVFSDCRTVMMTGLWIIGFTLSPHE